MPATSDPTQTNLNRQLLSDLQGRLSAISYVGPGVVEAIVTTPNHDEHVLRTDARLIPGKGVEGDGPYKKFWKGEMMEARQISAINAEVLDAVGVGYNVSGDNLIIRGIDLSRIEKGDRIKIGDAVLVATGTPHRPCDLLAERTSNTHKAALSGGRLRGAFFDALDAVSICVGDEVELIVTP